MSKFRYDSQFPLDDIDRHDDRFMSRIDKQRMDANVERLKDNIALRGQIDPVGVAKLKGDTRYILVYGFTRTEAIRRLGWQHIKANVYEDLSAQDGSLLNAENNSMRVELDPYEKALQIKSLRNAGVPVDTDDPEKPSICNIMKMSRRNVFNWLRVIEYECPELQQAIAEDKISLKHALEFVRHDPEIVVSMLQDCIDKEWTSSELQLRLNSAELHCEDKIACEDSAGLHGENKAEEVAKRQVDSSNNDNLRRAGTILMRYSEENRAALTDEDEKKLHNGLRMVLEVIMT